MASIEDVLLPPSNPLEMPTEIVWRNVEQRIGKLPDDYIQFLNVYGTGSIDSFLWILSPSSANPHLNLCNRSDVILAEIRDMENIGDHFEPEIPIGQLMPCGITDNGDYLFWWKKGTPNNWTIALNESRSPRIECFDCGLTEWLVALLTRRFRSDVLPRSFPSERPNFEPRIG